MFGSTSSGVAADFQHAIGVAHTMVWRLGMGSKYLGDWMMLGGSQNGVSSGMLSEEVRRELNQETNQILQACPGSNKSYNGW